MRGGFGCWRLRSSGTRMVGKRDRAGPKAGKAGPWKRPPFSGSDHLGRRR